MPFVKTQIVPINNFSDGDPSHGPKNTAYWMEDPTLYLEKIATLWMKHRGESVAGVRYVLDRLPDGYTLWAKRRTNHEKVIDKWLYGHPNNNWFDSANRFFPHFLQLMDHGTNIGCPCTVCASKGGKIPPLGANRIPNVPVKAPKSRGQPRINELPPSLDAEGTPDIYRTLINRLLRDDQIDVPIEERMSLDWRVETGHLREMLDQVPTQPSWIPRLGELVLFVRHIAESSTIQCNRTGELKIFNKDTEDWGDFPLWEAGVITQVAQEGLQIEELVQQSEKDYQVNYAGFRVEPLSDPNSKSKPFSRQYKYVHLHHLRPFTFWAEVLHGAPQEKIHETIRNTKMITSSLTLLGKHRFKGVWPVSDIYCKGLFLGSELVVVGDTVRLVPSLTTARVTDILKVTAIKLRFSNLHHASGDDQSEGHPYNSKIILVGKAYTTDFNRAVPGTQPIRSSFELIPEGIHDYGKWYPLHASGQSFEVPSKRVLSRCYSSRAMHLWFSSSESDATDVVFQSTGLSSGLQGTLEAREFAAKHDKRLSKEGKTWLWAETRAEALDVHTINGIETAKHDESRDPKRWVRYIKELDGVAGPEDKAALIQAAEKSRRSFGGLAGQSSFIKSAMVPTPAEASDVDDQADEPDEAVERASKRSRSVVVESREQSEDIDQVMDDFIGGKGSLNNEARDTLGTEKGVGRLEQLDVDDDSDEQNDVVMLDKFQSRQ